MIKQLSIAIAAAFLCAGMAQAADTATCEKQAAEKKLAGAAKTSFVKKCSGGGGAAEACDKQAAEKKLAGAAKNSFVKKCTADAK